MTEIKRLAVAGPDDRAVEAFTRRIGSLGFSTYALVPEDAEGRSEVAEDPAEVVLILLPAGDVAAAEREFSRLKLSAGIAPVFILDDPTDEVLEWVLGRNPAGLALLDTDDESLLTTIKSAFLRKKLRNGFATTPFPSGTSSGDLADFYLMHDERGLIVEAGQTFSKRVREDRKALIGKAVSTFLPLYDAAAAFENAKEHPDEALFQHRLLYPVEGLELPVRVRITLLQWGGHELLMLAMAPHSNLSTEHCPTCGCEETLQDILNRHDILYVSNTAAAEDEELATILDEFEAGILTVSVDNGTLGTGLSSGDGMPAARAPRSRIRVDVTETPVLRNGKTVARVGVVKRLHDSAPPEKKNGWKPPSFKPLVENAADLILLLDAEGLVRYASPSAEWLLGYLPEELLGQCIYELLHIDDVSSTRNTTKYGARTPGFITSIEFRIGHRDGDWRIFEGIGQSLVESPSVSVFVITIRDVTERKLTEDALRESEERFRQLADNTSQVFWMVEVPSEEIIYINDAFEKIWGFSRSELFKNNRLWLDAIYPEDREHVANIRKAWGSDNHEVTEYRVVRPDGTIRWVLDRSFPIHNREGHIYRTGGIAEDITERKRYETRIIAAKEKAEEMARLKTALLTNMSHEIRTPLTGIIGFASVLSAEVTEQQREFVELIERSGKRLMNTLNSVLDLARLEARQMETRLEVMDVALHVKEAVATLRQLAAERHIELNTDLPEDGAFALLDRTCLDIILNNIVGNAIKFTEKGSVNVSVTADDDTVKLIVKDTGVGISEEFLPKLFVEFSQESTGLARSHEGSGLGLSITQRLVHLLAGTLDVRSKKGEGTEFTVNFLRAAATSGNTRATGNQATRQAPALSEAKNPPTRRLLIVEDNADSQRLYHFFLGSHFTIEIAPNAEKASRLAENESFDAILIDINLGSGSTGVELLEMLRNNPLAAATPLIAVTAYALPGDREYFLSCGFNAYVGKPFSREELLEALRTCRVAC